MSALMRRETFQNGGWFRSVTGFQSKIWGGRCAWGVLCLWLGVCGISLGDEKSDKLHFVEAKVRPLLAAKCFKCHGAQKQHSGLRLDSREGILKGGEQGPAMVVGDPAKSLIVSAVKHEDGLEMPPEEKLPAESIQILEAWVKQGGLWPANASRDVAPGSPEGVAKLSKELWSLQPVTKKEPPVKEDGGWSRSTLDRFVFAKLSEQRLKPNMAADRRTWIRRVTIDLHGLPATAEEIAAFEADQSPQAFETVVERLLASPRYGERWGRYWLDLARYADTKGYVFFQDNKYPWAYTYRDYVIEAFNKDLPYNQFVKEQIAADQLPDQKDAGALRGLGFLTVGGRFMNNQQDVLDDRIDTIMRGLQGLTMSCARCHDHKFDPLPMADYYSLYGILESSREPEVPPEYQQASLTADYTKFQEELTKRRKALEDFTHKGYQKLANSARQRVGDSLLAADLLRKQPRVDDFMLLSDAKDINPKMGLRWQLYLEKSKKSREPVFLLWHELADLPEKDFEAAARKVMQKYLTTEVTPKPNAVILGALGGESLKSLADVAGVYQRVFARLEGMWSGAVKQGRDSGTPVPQGFADASEEELRHVMYDADMPAQVMEGSLDDLNLFPERSAQERLQNLRKEVYAHMTTGAAAPPRAMVLEDGPLMIEPYVYLRGNPNNRGPKVARSTPTLFASFSQPVPGNKSGRLQLAEAIADPKNPLTARVIVNRVWMLHFGSGLVRTPGDFGTRSGPPSHPELLDTLAAEFMERGWSLKWLHRQMVLSATYRQKSDIRPEAAGVDPENRLLWRMNRRRLDFEALRDSLLFASGELNTAVGGPSVDLFSTPFSRRRSLYGSIDRQALPGLLRTFDYPSPDATSPQREQTTVAPQALFLMNNPFLLELSQKLLAVPKVAQANEPAAKVSLIYRMVLSREPTAEESKDAVEFVKGSADGAVAWRQLAQVLMLTNEFAYVD